jgi:hypothetical protein
MKPGISFAPGLGLVIALLGSVRDRVRAETRWTTPTEPAACTLQVEATTGDGQVHVFEVAATLN